MATEAVLIAGQTSNLKRRGEVAPPQPCSRNATPRAFRSRHANYQPCHHRAML